MHLVDVHAHLDHPLFKDDLDLVLKRAKGNGVVAVIAQGTNHESNMRALAIAQAHPEIVKAALGLYPCEALNVAVRDDYPRESRTGVEETLRWIESHAKDIVALGEVGLDLKESDDIAAQRENLRQVIRLSKRIHKPLILHSRKAELETLDLLEEEHCTRAVLHCFMGPKKVLERAVRMGLHFSIPAAVVRNAQFQQNAELVPIGQLLTETDAPYLGPLKDVRSEPANVRESVLKIAELKRMDPHELANALYLNYQRLFQ